MTIVYHDEDAFVHHLKPRRIALIGYGKLGRVIAQNLRDSGLAISIGNQPDRYAELAAVDGFEVNAIEITAQNADLLFFTLPDELTPYVYLNMVAPYLRQGQMLIFPSGYNIVFGFIEPPAYVDAGVIAPRTLPVGIRDGYLNGLGYPCYVSIAQDSSGRAWDYLLAMAKALGALRQGAVEIPLSHEVELDLFLQQAVLPAIHGLLLMALQILQREGYAPEIILNELYLSGELGMLFSRAAVIGFSNTVNSLPMAGQYSVLSRTERFQDAKIQRQMESILQQIRKGEFAQEWASEFADGYPRLDALMRRYQASSLWRYESIALELLRSMLPPLSDDDDQR